MDPLAIALEGRYRIQRELGAGGMATVYLAEDIRHKRQVALKVLAPQLAAALGAERFVQEIATTAKLQHPHILPLFDSGSAGDFLFYVMPFVPGETLRERLQHERRIDFDEALAIALEVLDALEYAHRTGIVHRDVKPENIMLSGGHALLMDFGIALAVHGTASARLTEIGLSLGTPAYMSPEQATGERALDARTDIYAVGCVLYEMLAGEAPFSGQSAQAIVAKVLTQRPRAIGARGGRVPKRAEAAVLRSLEKRADDRFASAAEFSAALQGAMPAARSAASRGVVRSRRRTVAMAAMAALAIGAAAWVAPRIVSLASAAHSGAGTQPTVLIGGVQNRTGDSTFDALLPELLATTLQQSRTVGVYPRANVAGALARMKRDPGTPIDAAVGREIAAREGLAAVVVQSITKLGSSFVLIVSAVLPDGHVLFSTTQSLADLSAIPARLDTVGAQLRKALGESASALRDASVPLDKVTSASIDAVRFYSQGRQRLYAGDPRGAIVFLRRAVELDSTFAMAQGALGAAYTNVQDMEEAADRLRKAAAFASRAPDAEREKILGDFAMTRRDFAAACSHFEVLVAMRPRDAAPELSLGWCSAWKLDFATAVSATQKAYDLLPSPRTRTNLAMVSFLSGDLEKAYDDAEAVRAQAPNVMQAWYVEGKVLMVRGDLAAARKLYNQMIAMGGDVEIEGHRGLADVARSSGRFDEARAELEAVRDAAVMRGNYTLAANSAAELAEMALELGRRDRFAAAMTAVSKPSSDPWIVYRVGRAWARAGRREDALAAVRAIDALSIGPSQQLEALKELLRAEIALSASNPADAVKAGEEAVRLESSAVANETLARAYFAAKRYADAAKSYANVLDHPQQRCESYDAAACYRLIDDAYWLARAKEESGDRTGATALLQRFVTAWDGAPPNPMLADAKRLLAAPR